MTIKAQSKSLDPEQPDSTVHALNHTSLFKVDTKISFDFAQYVYDVYLTYQCSVVSSFKMSHSSVIENAFIWLEGTMGHFLLLSLYSPPLRFL